MNGEAHTAAYKIWHYLFEVVIAKIHLESAEYTREAGVVVTGNKDIDFTMAQEKVHARFTAWALAEYVSEGVSFTVPNSEDCAKMYQMIQEHQSDWLHAAESNPNIVEAPIEDLRKLDELAGYLFPFARLHLMGRPFHGKFMETIDSIKSRRGGMTRHRMSAQSSIEAPADPTQRHHPLSEALALKIKDRKQPWRNGGS